MTRKNYTDQNYRGMSKIYWAHSNRCKRCSERIIFKEWHDSRDNIYTF